MLFLSPPTIISKFLGSLDQSLDIIEEEKTQDADHQTSGSDPRRPVDLTSPFYLPQSLFLSDSVFGMLLAFSWRN